MPLKSIKLSLSFNPAGRNRTVLNYESEVPLDFGDEAEGVPDEGEADVFFSVKRLKEAGETDFPSPCGDVFFIAGDETQGLAQARQVLCARLHLLLRCLDAVPVHHWEWPLVPVMSLSQAWRP